MNSMSEAELLQSEIRRGSSCGASQDAFIDTRD